MSSDTVSYNQEDAFVAKMVFPAGLLTNDAVGFERSNHSSNNCYPPRKALGRP